ncbi:MULTISPECIES: CAP-associated domain-containing protein [Carnobacterium]|uniref:CAP-associated domain-containing protein n=1 Tax=Carnobacterium divergens TaxID=2748 RepID=A0A2R8A0U8_CARDV|nr:MULTISPECIES: CAP-associated domain-containing protein [Carnobacterium]MCO6017581.1 CAP-associated domain-containing protein [Carnobacterium divergens]MDT1939051.1 CAP-associated domain-containing protein [Carnobacterium divergens]MDT1941489.1 CAP-associated domain-containing protein [Carnobacterium divergens]MDT1947287.1 CAP-associated domain-containing protein [Carnobacterium divergens]MDT1949725.1 CAP-associated domain-containing protein [Carnobacterium divergens]
MKTFLRTIPLFIVAMVIVYALPVFNSATQTPTNKNQQKTNEQVAKKTKTGMVQKTVPVDGLADYIGISIDLFTQQFGEPVRKDETAYDFQWWIYNQKDKDYLQVGVKDGKIVTIFALGTNLDVAPFKIGMTIDSIYSTATLYPNFEVEYNEDTYELELSESDMNNHPLIAFDNGTFAILILDQFTNKVIGIRYLDVSILMYLNLYEVVSKTPTPSVSQDNLDWNAVNQGNQQEAFEIINVLRRRNKVPILEMNPDLNALASQIFATYTKPLEEATTSNTLSEKKIGEFLSKNQSDVKELQPIYFNQTTDVTWAIGSLFSIESQRELLMSKQFNSIGMGYQKHEALLLLNSDL